MAAVTNAHLLEAILGLTEAIKAQHVVATEPTAPATKARTRKSTVTAAPKGQAKLLTKTTRKAFIAQAAKEGLDFEGWSTWDLAFYCVSENWAPQGFGIGEGYTRLAVEAGA